MNLIYFDVLYGIFIFICFLCKTNNVDNYTDNQTVVIVLILQPYNSNITNYLHSDWLFGKRYK